jgi:homogentisate 1,2-dioxygenase
MHKPFERMNDSKLVRNYSTCNDHLEGVECISTPNQLRWSPFPIPNGETIDFVDSLATICGQGS